MVGIHQDYTDHARAKSPLAAYANSIRAADQAHAGPSPGTAWPIDGNLSGLSRGRSHGPRFRCQLRFSTVQRTTPRRWAAPGFTGGYHAWILTELLLYSTSAWEAVDRSLRAPPPQAREDPRPGPPVQSDRAQQLLPRGHGREQCLAASSHGGGRPRLLLQPHLLHRRTGDRPLRGRSIPLRHLAHGGKLTRSAGQVCLHLDRTWAWARALERAFC